MLPTSAIISCIFLSFANCAAVDAGLVCVAFSRGLPLPVSGVDGVVMDGLVDVPVVDVTVDGSGVAEAGFDFLRSTRHVASTPT